MTPTDYATVLAAAPIPLVLVGSDDRIALANPAAGRLLGAGITGHHYITALRAPALLECIESARKNRGQTEATYLSAQGHRDATYRVLANPVTLQTGQGVLVSFEDVSTVQEAGQMRRDFVANVSHELRTPLTALMGYLETLRGAARDDAPARARFLAAMQSETERMNRLVHDLLSLSRVESEERARPTTRVDVATGVRAAVQSLAPLARARDVQVDLSIDASDTIITGDADQLQQVFTNLLENALKYGAASGQVTIAIRDIPRDPVLGGPALEVAVQDQGRGIEAHHLPRLGERFYRVDAHRAREVGGTGLGLAIVKHIVSRHRGRLRIDSETGKGSRFRVILPQG